MLQFRNFLPAYDKVKQVEFHPVQPWVAVVSKSNSVTIWDWASLKAIQELQMGGYDEEAATEQNLAKLAEKDPSLGKAPASLQSPVSRLQSGSVKQVKFYDVDTAHYQLVGAHNVVNGTAAPLPSTPGIRAVSSHSLLVMACENKVVVMDLVSRRSQEVPRAALENKAPTCLAFLAPQARHAALLPAAAADSPILAVGLADGSARLIQLSNLRIIAKLPAAHKAGLSQLLVVPSKTGDLLLGGDSSGNVIVWEPFGRPLGMGASDLPHRLSFSAHKDKEILSMCLGYAGEEIDKTVPRLLTAGADNRVASWDLSNWREANKQKVDSKTPVMGIAFGSRNYSSIGSHNVTLATGTSVVFAMHAHSGSIRHVCNLNGIIPSGSKKVPKIYCVAQHPLQPHLVVVGANTGAAILSYDSIYLPPATGVPGDTTAPSLIDPMGSLGESSNISYATLLGSDLWTATATPHLHEENGVVKASGRVSASTKIGAVANSGKAWINVSHDGQYVSVAWPIARSYTIYHRASPTSWQEVDKGSGVCVAWSTYHHRYAVLEEPHVAALPEPSKPKRGLGKNKGPDPAALKAAMQAAASAAAANTRVVVKEVNGRVSRVVKTEVGLRGDIPSYLHGGPVLGVVYRRSAGSTWQLSEDALQAMQFYSWDDAERVGGELPEPMWMSWDQHNQHVAMAYPTKVMLCAVRPTFHPLLSLPLAGSTSATWEGRQLFVATATKVVVAYALPPYHPIVPLPGVTDPKDADSNFQLVTLASFDAGEPMTGTIEGGKEAGLPHPERRPPGPLVVLGTGGGYLWLLNSQAQPIPLSLSHAGLKARQLASSGDFQGGALVAEMRITPQDHDAIATFLSEMGGRAGAAAALTLSGLSLPVDIEMSVRAGQWERVVGGCRALLAGCNHRPAVLSAVALPTPTGMTALPGALAGSVPPLPGAANMLGVLGLPSPGGPAALGSPGMSPALSPGQFSPGMAPGLFPAKPPPLSPGQLSPGMSPGISPRGLSPGVIVPGMAPPASPVPTLAGIAQGPGGPINLSDLLGTSTPPNTMPPTSAASYNPAATLALAMAGTGPGPGPGLGLNFPPQGAAGGVMMTGALGALGDASKLSTEDAPALIDWAAPIKQAARARQTGTVRTAPTASSSSSSSGSITADPAAIDAVLRVADAALAAGLRDAAQRIVALLLEAASVLPVSTLGRVAVRVQEVGLKQHMTLLHTRLSAFATCSEEASGLFSAAVSGVPSVLQAALGQGKAPALAALQAANYRLTSAMAQETAWNTHLRSVGGLESISGLRFQVTQY